MKKIAVLLLFALCLSVCSCNGLGGGSGPHTVSFVTNEGAAVPSQEVSTLTEAPITTRDAHVFCGWFLDKDLKQPVSYPLSVERNITLYAKWSKSGERVACENAAVQFSPDSSVGYKASYPILPQELDMKALAAQGYSIQIDVTYEVYYEKNYNVPFDVGYMGAPDHDACIVDDAEKGEIRENIPTATQPQSHSISTVVSASYLLESTHFLMLLTYNSQNMVYFQNVVINYTCLVK